MNVLHPDHNTLFDKNGVETGSVTEAVEIELQHKSRQRRKCSSCLFLRVFCLSISILISLLVCSLYFYHEMTVCTTTSCIISAARLLASMDPNANPCEDFYAYACGSWMNESVNLNYPNWNTLYKTTVAAHDRAVRAMLEASDGIFPHELNSGEKSAVAVFRQCTDGDTMVQLGVQPMLELMDELGGWMPDLKSPKAKRETVLVENGDEPLLLVLEETAAEQRRRQRRELQKDSLEDLLLSYFNISLFPLFFAGVQVNYMNSSQHIITMYDQVPLLVKTSIYHGPQPKVESLLDGTELNPTARLLFDVGIETAEIVGESSQNSMRRIAEMIKLEWKIINCRSETTEHENDLYKVVTMQELSKMAPFLNWPYFFSKLIGIDLKEDEPVALKTGRQWIQQLAQVIEFYWSHHERQMVLRSYMKWKVLMYYLSYTKTECAKEKLWQVLMLYSGPPHLRKEFCILRLSGIFPLSLPSLLRKADGEGKVNKNREAVRRVGEEVRNAYKKVLETTELLDEYTRENTIAKIENMSIKVSFPDKMNDIFEMEAEANRIGRTFFESMKIGATAVYQRNLARLRENVDPRDWVDTRPAMSAIPVHNYERNLVILPMDVLYPPIADYHQIDSMNYGSIGSSIGHEMTHAFDGEGKQHGPTGNLDGAWWSSSSRRKFLQKEKCIVDFYANMTSLQSAQQSRYENMADMVGLEVSYAAWRSSGRDRWWQLPGLPITSDQRFFLAYAQGWCSLSGKRHDNQVHLTERIRIIGTLQNSDAFSKAFSCPLESPMNPRNKCGIW